MEGLLNDLRFALRSVTASPAVATVVIVTLALGIGANAAVFSLLNATVLSSLPFPESDRLVIGRSTRDGRVRSTVAAPDYYDYQEQCDAFQSLAAIQVLPLRVAATGGAEPELLDAILVSWNLFPTLGVDPALGRHFTEQEGEADGPSAAIISHGYWQRRFGGAHDVAGTTIILQGRALTVVGVMPPGFRFLHPEVDVWAPMVRGGPWADSRGKHNFQLIGRLATAVTLRQAQSRVDSISHELARLYPETNRDKGLLLSDFQTLLVKDYRLRLLLLNCAMAVVLLLACGNVTNLLLARASARRPEIAIRAALGASKARLTRQFLAEGLVLGSLAGFTGFVIGFPLRGLALRFFPVGRFGITSLGVDLPTLGFTVAVSIAVMLFLGIVPALQHRNDVADDLRVGTRAPSTPAIARFRGALVVTQVALSAVLLVGAGLLIRSFLQVTAADLGFLPDGLFTSELRLDPTAYRTRSQRIGFFTGVAEELAAASGVEAVGLIDQLPIRDPGNNVPIYAAARPPDVPSEAPTAYTRTVLPGYFKAMGIALERGRDIAPADHADAPRVVVISERVADTLFPGEDPLGRQVVLDPYEPYPAEVVGVVGDVCMGWIDSDDSLGAVYRSYLQVPYPTMKLAVRATLRSPEITRLVKAAVWRRDREVPLSAAEGMQSVVSSSLADRRVLTAVLSVFAAVALAQGMVGLFGLLAYDVNRRRHEIAVRMALGARSPELLRWVVGKALRLVCLGLVLGALGGMLGGGLIRDLLYGVAATDPLTYVGIGLLLALTALMAGLLPAWRAVHLEPARVLQAE